MTLSDKRVSSLFRDVSSTIADLEKDATPKRVHRLRTTTRRIESALAYTHAELRRKQQHALDELQKLRKRAGKVRDCDVQLKLLDAIGNGSTAADRRQLAEALGAVRSRQVKRLLATTQKLAKTKFLTQLSRLEEAAQRAWSRAQETNTPLQQAQSQIVDLAGQFTGQAQFKPRKLHQLRIALKRVRYVAELADESEARSVFLETLKTVQDALGDWHDWEELCRLAEKQFSQRTNCPLVGEIRALFAAKQAAARTAVENLLFRGGAAPARKAPGSVAATALAQSAS